MSRIKQAFVYKVLVVNGLSHQMATKRADSLLRDNMLTLSDIKEKIEECIRYPALDEHGNVWEI